MTLKKPEDFFHKEEEISIVEQVVEKPELKSFSDAFNSYKQNISKFENLSEIIKGIEDVQNELKEFIKKEDLDNATISYAFLIEETITKLKEDVKGINERDLTKIKFNISELALKVDNFAERELPKYKNNFVESEIKASNRYDKFTKDVNDILIEIENTIESKYESIDVLNKDTISEITKSISKHKIDIEQKTEKNINEFTKTLDTTLLSLEEKINSISDDKKELFNDLSKNIKEIKNLKKNIIDDLGISSSYKKEISSKVSDLEVEILRNETHLKEQSININEIYKQIESTIEDLNLSNLKKQNQKLSKKIKYLENVFETFNEKTILDENILTESIDPLVPLDQNFVTLDQLQAHYRLFINRIQQQLSSLGGGGIEDAPKDGKAYIRKSQEWIESSEALTWTVDSVGVSTTKNVGIGTTLAASNFALDVRGDTRVVGVGTFKGVGIGTTVPDGIALAVAGFTTFQGFVQFDGLEQHAGRGGCEWDAGGNRLHFADNVRVAIGSGRDPSADLNTDIDLWVDPDGSHIISIEEHFLEIIGNNLRLGYAGTDIPSGDDVNPPFPSFMECKNDEGVDIFYNNGLRIQTTNAGVAVSGIVTATSGIVTYYGDGSKLTGVTASSSISIKDSGSNVGAASTIDFGTNLSVSALSSGIVTVTSSATGVGGTWAIDDIGISTTKNVGIGTTAKDGYSLYVQGDTRITGILTVGEASITLDPSAKKLTGLEEIQIGSGTTAITIKKSESTGNIEFADESGNESPVGIGTTVDINTSGIITAASFDSKGSIVGTSLSISGITTTSVLKIGTGITASGGIITATTFKGALDGNATSADSATNASGLTGNPNITVGTIVGTALSVSGITTIGNVIVGGATTDLIVNGDARVTGILTIGTSSLTLDGSNNKINVGSATTIESTGYKIGNSFVHATGISAADVTFENIVGTALSVSGISSLGNVSGGFVKLYNNSNLVFETVGTGVSVSNAGLNTATIFGPQEIVIDPHPIGVGTTSGIVRIKGDLYVDGTEFIVNSETITLGDFVVGIATTVTTDALTDGAGIGIGSIGHEKTFKYNHSSTSLKSSENLNVASGKGYQIAETEVLNATTLGSAVVNSSLTSVGTLGSLNVTGLSSVGTAITMYGATGIVSATSFYGSLVGNADSATTATNASGLNGNPDINVSNIVGTALSISGISSVGAAITMYGATGIVSATSFYGSLVGNADSATNASGLNGNPDINVSNIVGTALSISGISSVGAAITMYGATGIVSATSFSGSGANLTGLTGASAATYGDASNVAAITVNSDGKITGISNVSISGGGGGGASGVWETNATGINTSTNVGIGTTTASDATLTVDVGTATTAIMVDGSEGQLFSVTNSLSSGSIFSVNDISGIPSIDVDADGTIQLAPYSASENVGLGTTNPTSKLHVIGGVKITGVLTTGHIADSNGTVGAASSVLSSTGSGLSWVAQSGGGGASGLWESNATGINTSTNVGIGTTTVSDASLTVDVGSASTAVVVQGSEGQLFSVTNSLSSGSIFSVNDITGIPSIDVDADGTIQLAPHNSTENVGLGTTNPTSKLHVVGDVKITGVVTATDFNSTSDIRLKTNIQPIGDPLAKVIQIEGVSFNWKEDNKPALGVIADQIESILPELVRGDDPKTVNYNGLIGLLIEAVKEQQIEIKQQQTQIDNLNERLSKLE